MIGSKSKCGYSHFKTLSPSLFPLRIAAYQNNKVRLCGASARGELHCRNNIPNQDSFFLHHGSWFDLIVISDGLGSCKLSHLGSYSIGQSLFKTLKPLKKEFAKSLLEKDGKKRKICRRSYIQTGNACLSEKNAGSESDITRIWLQHAHAHWLKSVYPYGVKRCRCTCLAALYCFGHIILLQLGDGICIRAAGDMIDIPFAGIDSDKDFSNMTAALGAKFSYERWAVKVMPAGQETVILTTDGICDDIEAAMLHQFSVDLADEITLMSADQGALFLRRLVENWPVPKHTDDKTIAVMNIRRSH